MKKTPLRVKTTRFEEVVMAEKVGDGMYVHPDLNKKDMWVISSEDGLRVGVAMSQKAIMELVECFKKAKVSLKTPVSEKTKEKVKSLILSFLGVQR